MGCPGNNPGHVVRWPAVLAVLCAVLSFISAEEDMVIIPDYIIRNHTDFNTDMSKADLDAARELEIKTTLEPQLETVFRHVTGFKSVKVVNVTIDEAYRTLVANWEVRLNRSDPKFVNATPNEIHDIILPDLKVASELYKGIRIDTSKRSRPSTTVTDDNLALGLGLGLGLGLPVLALVILAVVLLARRSRTRMMPRKKAGSSLPESSSDHSNGSSKLDPDPFRYQINGGFVPSESNKSSQSSGSAGYITPVYYDTVSTSAASEGSAVYAVIN